MADPWTPLFPDESEEAILARMAANANDGLSPGDERWVDTREGLFWRTMSTPVARELARIYDLMGTEVPASGNPLTAWGDYLDLAAEVLGLERLPAIPATAVVTFTGSDGTVISAGTEVGAATTDPDVPAPSYSVDVGGTIGISGTIDLAVTATEVGELGDVPANAITEELTPTPGVTSRTNDDPAIGGSDPETDEALSERLIAEYAGRGPGNVADHLRWARAWPGVGGATVIAEAFGPGTVHVILSAPDGGPVSAQTVLDYQNWVDPPSFTSTLTEAITLPASPVKVVDASGFRALGFVRVGGALVQYTNKTGTQLQGASGGSGTHGIGTLVAQGGASRGQAPPGQNVLVSTADTLDVVITAIIEFEPDYSLDGAGGTAAIDAQIKEAVEDYVNRVEAGGEVVRSQVAARIASVVGVHDVGGIELNGVAANLAIPGDPPQVPRIDPTTGWDLSSGDIT